MEACTNLRKPCGHWEQSCEWKSNSQLMVEWTNLASKHLNLKENTKGIYECQGRIQGHYPVYLPSKSLLSEKLIFHAHLKTIHGRVNITMTNIRENYWIPRLRQLTKKIISKCHGCKNF